MDKKGFTLIEMLIVGCIVTILVVGIITAITGNKTIYAGFSPNIVECQKLCKLAKKEVHKLSTINQCFCK